MRRTLARLAVLSAVVLAAACSDTTAPAPRRAISPAPHASKDESGCRSGYIVAYDETGALVCVPVE